MKVRFHVHSGRRDEPPAGYKSVVSVHGTLAVRCYQGFGREKCQPRLGGQFNDSSDRRSSTSRYSISGDAIEFPYGDCRSELGRGDEAFDLFPFAA